MAIVDNKLKAPGVGQQRVTGCRECTVRQGEQKQNPG